MTLMPCGHFELVDGFAQFVALLAFDAARTPPPRGLFGIRTR